MSTNRIACWVCVAAATALSFAAIVLAPPASAQETLRVMSFGGAYQDAQRKTQFKPFEAASGVKIVESTWFADLGKVKAMVEAKNVTADIILGDVAHALVGCAEGFLEPYDLKAFGDPKDYIPGTLLECGIPTELVSILYAYNEDKIPAGWGKNRPSTVADMFDAKKFEGKRAFSVRMIGGLPEKTMLADGVKPADIYKVLSTDDGVKRMLAKLDTIRDQTIYYTSNAQPAQLLSNGEVAVAQSSNGRIYAATQEGKKFVAVWDGQVYYPDVWFIPKGGNKALAVKFLQFLTEPKNMAALANEIPYAPARYSAQQIGRAHV